MKSRIVILALSVAVLSGCGHARIQDFKADRDTDMAVLFGSFKIMRNGVDSTDKAVVTFENGASLVLDKSGLAAVHVRPGHSGVKKIVVPGAHDDYMLTNLSLRSGPAGTKTYFGHVTLYVEAPDKKATDLTERYTWKVENKWKNDASQWTSMVGQDKLKTYASMAQKTGAGKSQGRSLASDRRGGVRRTK